jgi:hypothetical protein
MKRDGEFHRVMQGHDRPSECGPHKEARPSGERVRKINATMYIYGSIVTLERRSYTRECARRKLAKWPKSDLDASLGPGCRSRQCGANYGNRRQRVLASADENCGSQHLMMRAMAYARHVAMKVAALAVGAILCQPICGGFLKAAGCPAAAVGVSAGAARLWSHVLLSAGPVRESNQSSISRT